MVQDPYTTHTSPLDDSRMGGGRPAKKRSGCGCFLLGCLILVILGLIPLVGGGIFIATLDEAAWGRVITSFLSDPSYSVEIKKQIEDLDKMTPEQRAALLEIYGAFLTNYQQLSPADQETLHKNIFIVLKKLVTSKDKTEPPQELQDIVRLLKIEGNVANIVTVFDHDEKTVDDQEDQGVEKELPLDASEKPYPTNYDF